MNGKIVISRLNDKSGPKSEDLISFPVFELQKGQARAVKEKVIKEISNNAFIRLI